MSRTCVRDCVQSGERGTSVPEAALRNVAVTTIAGNGATVGVGAAGGVVVPVVPVLPALRSVIPGGGLRPGSTVGLSGPGASSLGLALVAGVGAHGGQDGTGGWCGSVGV